MSTYYFPYYPTSGLHKGDKLVFTRSAFSKVCYSVNISGDAYNPKGGNNKHIRYNFTEQIWKWPYDKNLGKIKLIVNGNACQVNGGSVWGTMDYMNYKKDLYIHLPANNWIPVVSSDIRTDPSDLYSRFLCAGGGGGYSGGNAFGGGWKGGRVGSSTPGTQRDGGFTESDRNWYTLGNFGFSLSDDYSPVDNPGGGWYGGCEAWSGHDCSGGSSYASGDPHCNGTQTNSGVTLYDTGTLANCSKSASMEVIIITMAYQENPNYCLYTRKNDIHKVILYYPNNDIGFPTDGSFKPLFVRDPSGTLCFACLYPQRSINYAEMDFIINDKIWYLSESY